MEGVNKMDYTLVKYYKYNGENWVMLQNGENILIAKRSAVIRLKEDIYTLKDDSEGNIKEISFDISNVDRIFIRK